MIRYNQVGHYLYLYENDETEPSLTFDLLNAIAIYFGLEDGNEVIKAFKLAEKVRNAAVEIRFEYDDVDVVCKGCGRMFRVRLVLGSTPPEFHSKACREDYLNKKEGQA